MRQVEDGELGEGLIRVREGLDRLEAVFVDGLRRFDKSREFAADGALSAIAWLRWRCKLSGGTALPKALDAVAAPRLSLCPLAARSRSA